MNADKILELDARCSETMAQISRVRLILERVGNEFNAPTGPHWQDDSNINRALEEVHHAMFYLFDVVESLKTMRKLIKDETLED